MKRKGIDREIVILLISAVITLTVWVGFDVYHAYTVIVQPSDMESFLLDIDPSLDLKTLNVLSEKNQ